MLWPLTPHATQASAPAPAVHVQPQQRQQQQQPSTPSYIASAAQQQPSIKLEAARPAAQPLAAAPYPLPQGPQVLTFPWS